ncbi:DNA starvation/stationary phase protection protein Dps [Jannaschia aquimarina]|uniref:Dps protein n=1 Tax=Jannaschia aquimarina TaxID=935700 RepID=A0A0D1EHC0_9RHOB|nr:DNA starvation/stationary phase protection protein Dps [Jannaschia aquimarina]KIT17074.1 DNA protection during starvation protein [Jannaschia aquimarina]SNS46187.1 starvation-inducible DNA-binding protein [Jannaschia aquimarina]
MPESFVSGLDQQTQSQMIDLLNARLADSTSLTLAVKQAHWNLRGRGYIGVHELLDEVADRLREHSDLMAERVAIMGGHAKGTVEVAAGATTLEAYPVELTDLQSHVQELVKRFKDHGAKVREGIEAADEAGDPDVEDLLTEVSREVDKDAWFIGANLAND